MPNKFGVSRLPLTKDGKGGGAIVIAYPHTQNHISDEDAEELANALLEALQKAPERYIDPQPVGGVDDPEKRAAAAEKRAEAAERRAKAAEDRERQAAEARAKRQIETAGGEEGRTAPVKEPPLEPSSKPVVNPTGRGGR